METWLAGSFKILCGRKSSFRALPSFYWKALPKQCVSTKCLFSINLHFPGEKNTLQEGSWVALLWPLGMSSLKEREKPV